MRDGFLYMKVYNGIKRRIEDGEYQCGDRLPSDRQFAEEYGVSMITVKKALEMLKERGMVKRVSGTGSFVMSAHPSQAAEVYLQKASSGHERKIGLVLEHISSAFGLDMMYHLDRIMERNGYHLLTRFSYYDRKKEEDEIRFLLEEGVEGLLVMPCHGMFYNAQLLKLILDGFPVVVLDKKMEGISVSTVRTDHYQAVESLVYKMYDQGCKTLGVITTGDSETPSVKQRMDGFYKTVEKLGIEVTGQCVLEADKNIYNHKPEKTEVDKVENYLKTCISETDGFVVMEYSLIPTVSEAAKVIGYDLVSERRVCCIDGIRELGVLHMQQDETKIAEKAAAILLRIIEGEKLSVDITIPAYLME